MAYFIHTDTDDAMLSALDVARDIDVTRNFEDHVASAEVSSGLSHRLDQMFSPVNDSLDVLDRLDRGVPTGSMTDWQATQALFANEPRAKNSAASVLARATEELDNLGSDALMDFVVREVEPRQQPVMVFSQETRCAIFNATNKFNGGIDLNKTTREKAMDDISRQGLSASIMLFTALGFPVED